MLLASDGGVWFDSDDGALLGLVDGVLLDVLPGSDGISAWLR